MNIPVDWNLCFKIKMFHSCYVMHIYSETECNINLCVGEALTCFLKASEKLDKKYSTFSGEEISEQCCKLEGSASNGKI